MNILLIPGAFDRVSNYGGYPGIDIWMRASADDTDRLIQAGWIIAASSGPNYVLSFPIRPDQKLILVNPLIKQRSFLQLVIQTIKFLLFDESPIRTLIPLSRYPFALRRAWRITKINVLEALRKLPKENITIIRGRRDRYFCNEESVAIIKREGFRLIEVDAGHVWNQDIADAIASAIL